MSSLRDEVLKIFAVVAAYWVVSISLVFLNKHVLAYMEFDFPIFVTWLQCLITLVCLFLLHFLTRNWRNPISVYRWRLVLHLKLSFVSICFVGMIVFNNLTLKLIPISYYNILRALTTVFNLIFTRVILGRVVSLRATACCGIIIIGFLLGLADVHVDLHSFEPVVIGVIASLFVSLFAIYTQSGLAHVNNNQWMLQTFNNINAALIMAPILPLVGELPVLIHRGPSVITHNIVILIVFSGILGFLIGLCTNLQIKYTSALTHNISGTAKACAQTVIAVLVNRERHTFTWWTGSILVLVGSGLYSYVRSQEMVRNHSSPSFTIP